MALFSRGRSANAKAECEINAYFDDLVSGVLAPRGAIEPEIAAMVSQIHQSGSRSAESPGLKPQLWEELMRDAIPSQSSASALPLAGRVRIRGTEPRSNLKSDRFAVLGPASSLWRWAMAILIVVGIAGGAVALRRDDGEPKENAAILAPIQSSPTAEDSGGIIPPASDCTVPMLSVDEISTIIGAAAHGFEVSADSRNFPTAVPNMETSSPPFPDGVPVNDATKAAIDAVYYTYRACGNAGSRRQQLWLFTIDGIARNLIPNGSPLFYNIAKLGEPPTPQSSDVPLPASFSPLKDMTLLPDGRIVAYGGQGYRSDGQVRYYLFKKINDQWWIDDFYCGTCG